MQDLANTKIIIKSPAKINLHLEVIGKREDGFHELAMIMQNIDLSDYLEFQINNEGLIKLESDCNDLRLDVSIEKYIDKLLRISFNSRRKMLRNTLNSILSNEEINELSESSKVCFNLRPQDISIDQWIKLAENYIKIKK